MTQISRRYLQDRKTDLPKHEKLVSCLLKLSPSVVSFFDLPPISNSLLFPSIPRSCFGLKSSTVPFRSHENGKDTNSSPVPSDADNSGGSASKNTAPAHTTTGLTSNSEPNQQDPDDEPPPEDSQQLTRTFNPFDHLKSTRETNEAIKAELLKPHPADTGFIYGFLHRNTLVRLGTGPALAAQVIKLGRTVNVKRRMKQWKKQCKYDPCVVLALEMPHHHRIERIVHHQLHNARLREFRCPGCGGQHNEWFRVNTVYAEHCVGMWMEFALRLPYDRFGALLPEWVARLEHVDLEDPGCWMWFVLGPGLGEPVSNVGHTEGVMDGSSELPDPSSDYT